MMTGRANLVLEPIETLDLGEHVYRVLFARLLSGDFSPGAKLDIDSLAESLQISRTPINNALIRLSEQGLVRIEPRRGTFICELTVQDVEDAYDLRTALELLGAEKGIPLYGPGHLEPARAILGQLSNLEANEAGHYLDYASLNVAFHIRLLELARNRRLVEVYKGLRIDLINSRLFYRVQFRDKVAADSCHRRILYAYEARDIPMARQAILDACEESRQIAIGLIQRLGGVI